MPHQAILPLPRVLCFMLAAMLLAALALSGCSVVTAKTNHESDSETVRPGTQVSPDPSEKDVNETPIDPDKADTHFGSMEIGEDTHGNTPNGHTLVGPADTTYDSYSYANRTKASERGYANPDVSECTYPQDIYEMRTEFNISVLDDTGYEVLSVCELGIRQAELTLAYDSDLFTTIDLTDEINAKRYGVTSYTAADSDGFVYDIFVPSRSLVSDYGMDGVFTSDYLFYYQRSEEGGPGELYRNLTPDEARHIFYGGAK